MANNALVFGMHLADEQNFFVTATKRASRISVVSGSMKTANLREARTCN